MATPVKKAKYDSRSLEVDAFRLSQGLPVKRASNRELKLAFSLYVATKSKFSIKLSKEIKKWLNGKQTYARFIKACKQIFKQHYEDAYVIGLLAKEIKQPPKKSLTSKVMATAAAAWVAYELADEMLYWKRFMQDVKRAKEDVAEPLVKLPKPKKASTKPQEVKPATPEIATVVGLSAKHQSRFNMYIHSLDSVYTKGRVESLPEGVIINWVYGKAEHCPDCVDLEKNSPYTKHNLPTVPRQGKTRCLSHCKCKLVFTNAPLKVYNAVNNKKIKQKKKPKK